MYLYREEYNIFLVGRRLSVVGRRQTHATASSAEAALAVAGMFGFLFFILLSLEQQQQQQQKKNIRISGKKKRM